MKTAEIMNDEREGRGLWWLSFCDTRRPDGYQFLGVAIVEADGFLQAIDKAHVLNINPGGEVRGFPVQDIPSEYHDRLLSREEVDDAGLC